MNGITIISGVSMSEKEFRGRKQHSYTLFRQLDPVMTLVAVGQPNMLTLKLV